MILHYWYSHILQLVAAVLYDTNYLNQITVSRYSALIVVVVVVVLTLTLVKNLESVVTQKGAGALGRSERPNLIKIRPGNTTLSRLKRTMRRRAHNK